MLTFYIAVTAGVNPVGLNRGLRKAGRMVAEEIKRIATVSTLNV